MKLTVLLSAALCAAFATAPAFGRQMLATPLDAPFKKISGFGERRDPFSGRASMHHGLDFVAPWGAGVRAAAGGVVVDAGLRQGYGLIVEIDHGDGRRTLYAHLSSVLTVKGAYAAAESLIGRVGSTGRSAGPALHFEFLVDGAPVDPEPHLDLPKKPSAEAEARVNRP